jgi:hypothetical protein
MFPTQFQTPEQGPQDLSKVTLEQQILTLQIIRGALIAGVLVFMAIVLGALAGMPQKLEFGMFEIILIFFLGQTLVVYLFAPRFVKVPEPRQNEIRKMTSGDKEKALMPFVTSVEIIRGAAIEGSTFFALILVMIADSKVGLIVGVFLIAVACALFPTASRIRSQVEGLRFRLGL